MDKPIPLQTNVRITYPKGELTGMVRYCVYREIGYFLGIEFETGSRWSQVSFRPQHMLDPRRLAKANDAPRDDEAEPKLLAQ